MTFETDATTEIVSTTIIAVAQNMSISVYDSYQKIFKESETFEFNPYHTSR